MKIRCLYLFSRYERRWCSSFFGKMEIGAVVVLFSCLICSNLADSLKIISREEWGAREPLAPNQPLIKDPPSHVIIHHSATPSCKTKAKCVRAIRSFQNHHMDTQNWNDIGYNFLVGEDGNVYEGRGWGVMGTHARPYNTRSIGICIIGTYTERKPNQKALNAVRKLITSGLVTRRIRADYKLIGHRQAAATECPGKSLYNEIKSWSRYAEDPEAEFH